MNDIEPRHRLPRRVIEKFRVEDNDAEYDDEFECSREAFESAKSSDPFN